MNERIRDRIAANMSYYRKKARMTQTEVAEQIHSKKNTISGWEHGVSCPDIDTLVILCDLYGISLSEMCGVSDNGITPEEMEVIRKYRNSVMKNAVDALLDASQGKSVSLDA